MPYFNKIYENFMIFYEINGKFYEFLNANKISNYN